MTDRLAVRAMELVLGMAKNWEDLAGAPNALSAEERAELLKDVAALRALSAQRADDRCRHGVRFPHECRDCQYEEPGDGELCRQLMSGRWYVLQQHESFPVESDAPFLAAAEIGRLLAALPAEQAQGAEPVAWAVYWKGLPAGSVPWFVSKGEPRDLHDDQYKVPLYAHAQPQAAPNDEPLQVALGALADIAKSRDMTISQIRHKAARIYDELTKDEPK
jgi:hypothetical protein